MTRVFHTLEPVYSKDSNTLILGSMPSVTSRRVEKYYGHKTNRFWKILESVYQEEILDWKDFILKHDLALWDVLASCDIEKSSDSTIKNIELNDIKALIDKAKIDRIFLLGKSAYDLYNKYLLDSVGIEGIYLPSPSSANAQYSLSDLIEEYKIIKKY